MHKSNYIILFLISILYFSCTDSPDFSHAPIIEFVSFSQPSIEQSQGNEINFIATISFTDGDGDIGYDPNDITAPLDALFLDARTGEIHGQFRLPEIPRQGTSNGISGEINFTVFSTCCIFPDSSALPCTAPDEFPTNDLAFDITITDRAGNVSNVLRTPSITLLCN